ncbi:radical SAM family heme chaperone HemW [Paramicrobacterium agarici]|uniref:radical SAM family heme chaperone HemW n=1 Tax=Paramicrobacterium agarici TaxID=630514 RepID=UPI000BF2F1DE|nr:radical SAM family heme chaperone HemW [Microbacterium agarici]
MPSELPLGALAPSDGRLPLSAAVGSDARDLGMYVHVPFCRVRCGYCDFNTYTATELRGARQVDYADEALDEVRLAGRVLADLGAAPRTLSTVFFGGGTPTLLPARDLGRMLSGIREEFGLAAEAEVTTEANPDSVDERYLEELAAAGFTRVSFGMQSAVPHVLATLERTHDPARIPDVVAAARNVGLDVSLDLIYGTPGESLDDWKRSLEHAIQQRPDHLSAYALIVEDGTKLARQIRRGEVGSPDDDLEADMYELANDMLAEGGFGWYEVSNWSTSREHRSRHNLSYWTGQDWWGIGPGAHSHVGGVRWWNVKHPAAYASRLAQSESPAAGREVLDDETRRMERILLETRIRNGLPIDVLSPTSRHVVAELIADELVNAEAALRGRVVLTVRGRLLADAVVRRLTD